MVLESAVTKWDRANWHLKSLDENIRDFARTSPVAFECEIERKSGDKVWRVLGKPAAPPTSLCPIIGDALYNFRSALDHLAWELVLRNGEEPSRQTAFPIFDSMALFNRYGGTKMKGMSSPMIAELTDCQPCQRRHPYRDHILWCLEELGNTDKHRHFNLTFAATSGGAWSPGLPVVAASRILVHQGSIGQDTELARFPREYADVDFSPIVDVAFGQALSRPRRYGHYGYGGHK